MRSLGWMVAIIAMIVAAYFAARDYRRWQRETILWEQIDRFEDRLNVPRDLRTRTTNG
jgi:hypothetical protein